jgi:hypothetical protein
MWILVRERPDLADESKNGHDAFSLLDTPGADLSQCVARNIVA